MAGIRVVMEPPPLLPPSIMLSGAMYAAETAAAASFAASAAASGSYAFSYQTVSDAGWGPEATLRVAFDGVDLAKEFGDERTQAQHTLARQLGL